MAREDTHQPFKVRTTLGENAFIVQSFEGFEAISKPYHFRLQLLRYKPEAGEALEALDQKTLLDKEITLSFDLSTQADEPPMRYVHGTILSIRKLETVEDIKSADAGDTHEAYIVEMVPWLWYLNLFTNCRVFQGKTVQEIVEQIFTDRGFSKYRFSLDASLTARDYCVQYRETDLNFVCRLLEEEGIFFFFKHTQDDYELVLTDKISDLPSAPYAFEYDGTREMWFDHIGYLDHEDRVRTGKITLNDYNFETPAAGLRAEVTGEGPGEIYDYHPAKYKTRDEGSRYANLRLDEQEFEKAITTGRGGAGLIVSGHRFSIVKDAAATEYICVSLRHHGRNTAQHTVGKAGAKDDKSFWYENWFECVKSDVKVRPRRVTPRPKVYGAHTAVVCGPSGEEIYTDVYGRVKVQFHWDREGQKNENSSIFVRVGQIIAGNKWGFVAVPRIGQEVIVHFLEGDPDQPIITGCVWNEANKPPYLPDGKTKTFLKTYSSPGGDGFNELRFEDKAGEEQIFIHAQKDMEIRVLNDMKEIYKRDTHTIVERDAMTQVKRDAHVDSQRDHVTKIGRDHHLEVTGKEAIKIGGSQSLKVGGAVAHEYGGAFSCQVTGATYIKAPNIVIEGTSQLSLKVGSNFVTIDSSGVAIKGTMVQINSGGAAGSGSAGQLVSPLAPTAPTEAVDDVKGEAVSPSSDPQQQQSMELGVIAGAAAAVAAARNQSPAGDEPTHDPNNPTGEDPTHFIEIKLVDEDGNPVPGEAYKITLPDGTTVADGTLDEQGYAKVSNIDPGTCKVSFPNLDQDAWEQS
ncbi:MAG: type VI secretion system tip protein TssI/VgrG [Bryobacteraceae bacterium]|nr:type VI secretion system tip protein TssI/VgrG [Bryobacteraceae bacterium]